MQLIIGRIFLHHDSRLYVPFSLDQMKENPISTNLSFLPQLNCRPPAFLVDQQPTYLRTKCLESCVCTYFIIIFLLLNSCFER